MSGLRGLAHSYRESFKIERKDWSNPYITKADGFVFALKIYRFGELNGDKVIYFITNIGSKRAGTFSHYISVLNEISYARLMNWIPVVDDTPGLLHKLTTKGKKGSSYIKDIFQIQNEISVDEVLQSQAVIFSDTARRNNMLRVTDRLDEMYKIRSKPFFNMNETEVAYWREFARNNFWFKADMQEKLDAAYQEVIGDRKNVCAVAVREGKMHLSKKVRSKMDEALQPSVAEILDICKKYFKEWNCSYIYLSCEAKDTVELFQREFSKERVLVLDRYRFEMKELDRIRSFRSGDKFHNSTYKIKNYDLDYIKEMYLLSKGDYFISAMNTGAEAAYIMSSGYKDEYIIRKE